LRYEPILFLSVGYCSVRKSTEDKLQMYRFNIKGTYSTRGVEPFKVERIVQEQEERFTTIFIRVKLTPSLQNNYFDSCRTAVTQG